MATTQLALQRFDITKTSDKHVAVIIGKRNSGEYKQEIAAQSSADSSDRFPAFLNPATR